MGAAVSACACGDGDNMIVSLASRCTNPPKSSVHDEGCDDDLLGKSIVTNNVSAENMQKKPGCDLGCSGNACNAIEHNYPQKEKPLSTNSEANDSKRSAGTRPGGLASFLPPAFDLTQLHPLDPPFLGSKNPPLDRTSPMKSKDKILPSLFDVDNNGLSCTPSRTIMPSPSGTPESLRSMLTSTTVSGGDEDQDSLEEFNVQCSTPIRAAKTNPSLVTPNRSREMAITSDEIVSTVNNGTKGNCVVPLSQVPLTPKRLFQVKEDEEEDGQYDESKATPVTSTPRRYPRRSPRRSPPHKTVMTPERIMAHPQPLCGLSKYKSCTEGPSPPGEYTKPLIYNGVLINGVPETPQRDGPGNEVHTDIRSSLPSQVSGSPIRLRLTDTTKCQTNTSDESDEWSISSSDYFSFRTPFFSSAEFAVTTPSGRPWGNEIMARMDDPNRTQVEDGDGNVLAIMRNAHTMVPSHIVYGSRPRYPGQRARSYRGDIKGGVNSQDASFETLASNVDEDFVQYYPWALIRKDGRLRGDSVSIHMAIAEEQEGPNAPQVTAHALKGFSRTAALRGQHSFDDHGDLSHSLVSRIPRSDGESGVETGTPCCLVLPSPVKEGVFDITIAPGIDPVLIICYVTLHARMDSEPSGLPHVHY